MGIEKDRGKMIVVVGRVMKVMDGIRRVMEGIRRVMKMIGCCYPATIPTPSTSYTAYTPFMIIVVVD